MKPLTQLSISAILTLSLYSSLLAADTTIYVDHTATGTGIGDTWGNAYPSLQDAVAEANTRIDGSGDTHSILVAAGTYYPDEGTSVADNDRSTSFAPEPTVALYGGYPTGGGVRDISANPTILSGDLQQDDHSTGVTDNAYHIIEAIKAPAETPNAVTILDGLTITAGNASGSSVDNRGSAIFSNRAAMILTDCTFTENSASSNGGAIFSETATSTVTNCLFSGNSAGKHSGAIHISTGSTASMINCAFSGNSASDTGGAIRNNGSATLTNCSFSGNSASNNGGAIHNNASTATLTNCIIWNNQANNATNTTSASIYNASSTPTYAYCLIANSSGSPSWDTALGTDSGNNIDSDPLFRTAVDPSSAPSTTGDLRLLANSPVIDAANHTTYTSNSGPATDLAGISRAIDITTITNSGTGSSAFMDIGAYEHPLIIFVNATPSGSGNDGTSWADAFITLQDALAAASFGSEIWVAAGTYYPDDGSGQSDNDRNSTFQLISSVAIYGGFTGTITETSLSDRNTTTNTTTLSGDLNKDDSSGGSNSENAYHVVTGSGTDTTTVLDGFTITAGKTSGDGGGLYNSSGSPTISHCTFSENSANRGGAIYNTSGSAPVISHCSLSVNSASFGGAIYNSNSSPVFSHCSLSGNSASYGGAVYNSNLSPVFSNCLFSQNSASVNGGAILSTASTVFSLTNCTFTGNSADDRGGAILNHDNSSLSLTNCIIWNNQANGSTTSASASVYNSSSPSPTYSYCLIANSGGSSNWDTALGTDGGNNIDSDPLFLSSVDPATSPSTSADLRLNFGSPAVDSGDNSLATSTDLLGRTRIIDGDGNGSATIDLGAYERPLPIYVDSTTVGGSVDGSSWTNAYTDLQSALATATSGDEIWVAAGTYYPDEGTGQADNDRDSTFQLITGLAIYGGFPANNNSAVFSDRDTSSYGTILSGDINKDDSSGGDNSENAYHVLTGSGTDTTAVLDGFTVTAGHAGSSGTSGGGGIISRSGSPTLNDCALIGNTSGYNGGAVYNSLSSPTFTNCILSGNLALSGGAVQNFVSSPIFINCSFSGNSSRTGGAIYNSSSSSPSLTNCIIWNNQVESSTTSTSASVYNSSSTPIYAHCLIANSGGSSSWETAIGIDGGNNIDADPLFLVSVDPGTAPTTSGDLRLPADSPAVDTGDGTSSTSINTTTTDILGNPRFDGTINLGAYEAIINREIAVTDPSGNNVNIQSTVDLGYIILNSDNNFSFTLTNLSYALDLANISVSSDNGEAAISPHPAADITATGSDSIGITITPTTTGDFSATISINSNAINAGILTPFKFTITAIAASDVDDSDGDTLSNYDELATHGTDPNLKDTDGDDVHDNAEIAFAAAGLDFANGTDDSAKLAAILSNTSSVEGLYTEDNIQDLALGQPVLQRDNASGNFLFKVKTQHSPDLGTTPWDTLLNITPTFDSGSGETTLEFTPPNDNAHFFRLYFKETP